MECQKRAILTQKYVTRPTGVKNENKLQPGCEGVNTFYRHCKY